MNVDERRVIFDVIAYGAIPILRIRAYHNASLARLKSLLERVDVNQPTGIQSSLLGYAAHCGWLDAVKYLVEEKGANVNQVGSHNDTPLHEAVWRHIDVVKYLIEQGAEVNSINARKETPLHGAVSFLGQFARRRSTSGVYECGPFQQVELIRCLIEAGAKVMLDDKGRTPLDLARESDAPEGLELLILPTLLSNLEITKPDCIEKNKDLSKLWDTTCLVLKEKIPGGGRVFILCFPAARFK